MNYFSKNLKYLRQRKKLSISELAQNLKINQSTISRWENETMGATIDNAYDVSNFFNISMADLLGKDLSIEDNEHDEEIHKIASNNGVQIIVDKNAPLTAESVVEVNKILMDIMNEQKKDSK